MVFVALWLLILKNYNEGRSKSRIAHSLILSSFKSYLSQSNAQFFDVAIEHVSPQSLFDSMFNRKL